MVKIGRNDDIRDRVVHPFTSHPTNVRLAVASFLGAETPGDATVAAVTASCEGGFV